jgi:hypothetical protein
LDKLVVVVFKLPISVSLDPTLTAKLLALVVISSMVDDKLSLYCYKAA